MKYDWTKDEAQVIKAAWATEPGRAAINLIIHRLCGIGRLSMDDSPVRTAFAEGRRFVAIELVNAVNVATEQLVKEPDDRSTTVDTVTKRAADVGRVAQQLAAGKPASTVRAGRRPKR
jgi:hypothetical protein